jgi:glycosyltransferase domain-containing protein
MSNYIKKLTIILTLKGRDEFTYRWMGYMNANKCPFKIIIADGGDGMQIEAHLRNVNNFPNLDYDYIRYPFDVNVDSFYKKLENVISIVKTDYILQADNDDFFLLDRIPRLIEFLDQNPDYVAARGHLVNFEVYNEKGISKAQVRGCCYNAYEKNAPSITDDCPLIRIEKLCHGMADYDYYSNWYSVIRTSPLQKIWSDLITIPIKEVIVLEILTHVFLMHAGKLKVISSPFYLRQSNTSVFGDTLVLENQFLERCIYNNAFSEFPYAVKSFMGLDDEGASKDVLKSIAWWLNIFIFNIQHRNNLSSGGLRRCLIQIKHFPFFGFMFQRAKWALSDFFIFGSNRQRIMLKEIEPFIISSNHAKDYYG